MITSSVDTIIQAVSPLLFWSLAAGAAGAAAAGRCCSWRRFGRFGRVCRFGSVGRFGVSRFGVGGWRWRGSRGLCDSDMVCAQRERGKQGADKET